MSDALMQTVQGRGETTKAGILQTARQLFSQHGYHGTGIADIQEATGLTKGAFYHHFRSKEDLALAILGQTRQEYAEELIAPAMQRSTPSERLEALLDGAVALNSRPEWCNCQMLATLSAELTPADERLRDAVQGIYGDLQERCRTMLAEAQDAGQASDRIDPDTGAQWISSTLTGLWLARKVGAALVPAKNLIDAMKHTLLKRPGKAKSHAAVGGENSR